MEATIATTIPTLAHVYFDVAERFPTGDVRRLVGDVDILLLDADGAILERITATADRVPFEELTALVDANLSCRAGLVSTDWDSAPVVQFRNHDGRYGYLTSAAVREA